MGHSQTFFEATKVAKHLRDTVSCPNWLTILIFDNETTQETNSKDATKSPMLSEAKGKELLPETNILPTLL